ncbi:MAG: hypothetical protein NTV00_02855 [Methylococcales bacterium]|nr:hypothetical protein [Methylococcales bacterium]
MNKILLLLIDDAAFSDEYIRANINSIDSISELSSIQFKCLNIPHEESRQYVNHTLFKKLYAENKELESMWKSVIKHYQAVYNYDWLMKFYGDVMCALDIPDNQKISASKNNRNIKRITVLCKKLSSLLIDSGMDITVNENMYKGSVLRLALNDGTTINSTELLRMIFEYEPNRMMSQFIRNIPKNACIPTDSRAYSVSKSPCGSQLYFIRRLNEKMIYRFKSPLHGLVSVAAATIFNNECITIGYVSSVCSR